MKIRIGTRTSKMAMAQAKTIAANLKAVNPNLNIEIIGISSAGDRDRKTPLWQMDIVGIFSRDIDEKLLSGEIDVAVHALKDLGTQRPKGIVTAALLKREDPRDIAIFRGDVLDKIRNGQPLILGSSAPRRVELVPEFLSKALPQLGNKPPVVQVVPLRGNVNTRIRKLRENDNGLIELDGIVVALGGLGRLEKDDEAHDELRDVVRGLRYMVLPLTHCPGAPGQGAIIVEALESRPEILGLFAAMHDEETARHFARERDVLIRYGGGCHQRFGAVSLDVKNLDSPLVIIRGLDKEGRDVSDMLWEKPTIQAEKLWDGQAYADQIMTAETLSYPTPSAKAVFIAHHRACPDALPDDTRIWVSGAASWFKLAEKGIWVEGCADGFGFDFVKETLAPPFLHLPPLEEWAIYTHDKAAETWPVGKIVATYRLKPRISDDAIDVLKSADIAWWGSVSQYDAMRDYIPPNCIHACGLGKTAETLRARGVSPLYAFPNIEACKNLLRKKEAA